MFAFSIYGWEIMKYGNVWCEKKEVCFGAIRFVCIVALQLEKHKTSGMLEFFV